MQYTVHPLTKLSQIFRPQMRPKNCCTSLATSKFGKLLKMLKWVGMRNCWQMVEKWTWWKSWNWLTCEIVDKSLKYGNYKRRRSLIAAANKVMTRTAGINYMFFHFPQGKNAAAPIQTLHVSHCTPMTLELYDFYLWNLRHSLQKPTSILPPLMNGHSLLICRHVITLFATNPD